MGKAVGLEGLCEKGLQIRVLRRGVKIDERRLTGSHRLESKPGRVARLAGPVVGDDKRDGGTCDLAALKALSVARRRDGRDPERHERAQQCDSTAARKAQTAHEPNDRASGYRACTGIRTVICPSVPLCTPSSD